MEDLLRRIYRNRWLGVPYWCVQHWADDEWMVLPVFTTLGMPWTTVFFRVARPPLSSREAAEKACEGLNENGPIG